MEKFTKEYFWVIHLSLLALMAFLSARVATNLLAGEIMALPTEASAVAAAATTTAGATPARHLRARVVDRNLFNANPPEEPEGCEGDECPPEGGDGEDGPISDRVPGPGEECKKSELKMGLAAIMMAEPAEWSVAIFDSPDGDRVLKETQELSGFTLASIQRQRVVFSKGGRFSCLTLTTAQEKLSSKGGRGRAAGKDLGRATSKKASSSKGSDLKNAVQKTGKNSYTIDRDTVVAALDTGDHLRQARALPSYKNGKSEGIKIVGIRPGSLYSHIGIRSGDVIKAVGDQEVTKPSAALRMFDSIKDAESLTIEVQRHNRPVTLEYSFK